MREEMKNTKKLGNKGFSLIELIIVIAIMAILIGIVGTQVVPYIEKSKQAKDQQILSGLLTSATTAFSSNIEAVEEASLSNPSFTFGDTAGDDALGKVMEDFYNLVGCTSFADLTKTMKSKAADDIQSITIARSDDGVVTVTTNMKTGSKYTKVFDVLSST